MDSACYLQANMADTKKAEMEALWEKLENQSSAGQLKKASKTADEILQLDNVNPTALHAKGALLVQRGNHEELLKFLEKPSGKRVETELAFEKAYCLYRLSRFQEALEALEAVREDRAAARLHLQAQLSHRLGHSKDSIAVYRELFSKHKDESLELRTNVLAAYVENQRAEEIPEVMEAMKISADKSYEIAFNQACGLLAGAKYTEAEALLLLAQRIGQEALYSEDLTEEEVTEEMAPVKAQLAFAAASLGRDSEAIEMLGEAIKAAKGDPATRAVAENNLVVSRLKVASSHKGLLGESLKHLEALMARPGVTTQLELQPV